MLKVGLIGCGGRGTGAAVNALRADSNVKLWALADAFSDQLEASLKSLATSEDTADLAARLDVPPERRFVGWDAYKGVIDSCDVVLLATSPHFRPLHLGRVVAAGKHASSRSRARPTRPACAPCARPASAASRSASRRLGPVLPLRAQEARDDRAPARRRVGDIVAMHTTYNAGALWHRGHKRRVERDGVPDAQLALLLLALGDHIAEQHIHSLDKLAWAMGEYPVRASRPAGARAHEPEYGNVYDHFSTVYEWKSGVKGFSYCRQWAAGRDRGLRTGSSARAGAATSRRPRSTAVRAGAGAGDRSTRASPTTCTRTSTTSSSPRSARARPINDGEYMCTAR
jgi:predicted dehydrogenase